MESCKEVISDNESGDNTEKSSLYVSDKYALNYVAASERHVCGYPQKVSRTSVSHYGTSTKQWNSNISAPNSSNSSSNAAADPRWKRSHLDRRSHALPLDFNSRFRSSTSYCDKDLNEAPCVSSITQPMQLGQSSAQSTRMSSSSILPKGADLHRYTPAQDKFHGSAPGSSAGFAMREMGDRGGYYPKLSKEQTCGPRSIRFNTHTSADKDQLSFFIRRDLYNKSDFRTNYEQARFFMIKSYSEDDVHKSIKYSVWSSTSTGNRKLDDAYRESIAASKEKATSCPVFLFFSVNSSGQFVGLCEMIGSVDFKKNMDFWQEDRWPGFFPVSWHIIKDIPNRHFQHIILENNEYKAVTFSRDTQEIGHPHGIKMLQMFKGYPHQTSVLDDFGFYEEREKELLASRARKPPRSLIELEYAICDTGFPSQEEKFAEEFMKLGLMQGSSRMAAMKTSEGLVARGDHYRSSGHRR